MVMKRNCWKGRCSRCKTKEARLILQSGIYTFFTNISEGTAFLLQGLTYKIYIYIYIFPTVKSTLLLLFYIFTYCWLNPLLVSGPSFLSAGPCFKNWICTRCTSSGFARSISCLCFLFLTTSLAVKTCFHTKFGSLRVNNLETMKI